MLNVLANKTKELLLRMRIWILYQNYVNRTARNLEKEVAETIDETFAENILVMNVLKERLIRLYNNDRRN